MRTGYFVFLVLLSGCSDRNGTALADNAAHGEKLAVIQVTEAFWGIIDARPALDAAARATRFRTTRVESTGLACARRVNCDA